MNDMRITKIESQKKNPRRKNLYADGEFVAGVSLETLVRAGLRAGDEITDDQVKTLVRDEERLSARRVALRFLGHRARAVKEVRDKLRENEFSDADIEDTIETLKQAGLLNDAEFARMFINDALSAKATGRMLLRRRLLLLGVEKEIVESALQRTFKGIDEQHEAMKVARKFLKKSTATRGAPGSIQLRQRLSSFLGRRGYTWDVIEPVIKTLMKEQEE
jgi:regulatory protein